MSIVPVELAERSYSIIIDSLDAPLSRQTLSRLTAGRSVMLVTDSNTVSMSAGVKELCRDAAMLHTVTFAAGEASKNFTNAAMLCGEAVRSGCDRSSLFIALGGGVTGDLTGFAASIFMRGVDFVQIPTSLLAMVDSSVGGKTGVDMPEGKNLAGSFYQPKAVFIDPDFLLTLPRRELAGAMAEIVKYGVIADREFFAFLEKNAELLADPSNRDLFSQVIRRSCQIKAETVSKDERDQGCRALLNYGHTFGHAVELLSDFALSHGEAVAIGMNIAGNLSEITGMWSEAENAAQRELLLKLGLPVSFDPAFATDDILNVMRHDKKTSRGRLNLVLPERLGHCIVTGDVPPEAVAEAIDRGRAV